jgi:hypothetical protein
LAFVINASFRIDAEIFAFHRLVDENDIDVRPDEQGTSGPGELWLRGGSIMKVSLVVGSL